MFNYYLFIWKFLAKIFIRNICDTKYIYVTKFLNLQFFEIIKKVRFEFVFQKVLLQFKWWILFISSMFIYSTGLTIKRLFCFQVSFEITQFINQWVLQWFGFISIYNSCLQSHFAMFSAILIKLSIIKSFWKPNIVLLW